MAGGVVGLARASGGRRTAWTNHLLDPRGYELDTDDLIGKDVEIKLNHRDYVKDGEPKTYVFVDDIRTPVRAVATVAGATPHTQGIIAAVDDP